MQLPTSVEQVEGPLERILPAAHKAPEHSVAELLATSWVIASKHRSEVPDIAFGQVVTGGVAFQVLDSDVALCMQNEKREVRGG